MLGVLKKDKVKDMTKGPVLKTIILFALPLLIGNVFQQIYNIVDISIAGNLISESSISAIGSTTSLYTLIVNLAFGMNGGYAIIMTREFGRKDEENLKRSIALSFVFNVFIATFLTITVCILLKPIMHLIKVPDSVFDDAYNYLFIICLGIIFTTLYNMFASILRAVGNSRVPLYFLIISSIINVLLDLFFTLIFNLGIRGLALATITSQAISSLISGIYFFVKYKEIVPLPKHYHFKMKLVKDMCSMGLSMTLMTCIVSVGSVCFQGATNNLGELIITSHTTSRKIIGAFMQPLSSLATSLSIFVGQNYGAKEYKRIREAMKKVTILEIVMALCFLLLVPLFGKKVIELISGSNNEEIISNGIMNLAFHFSMYAPLGLLFCYRNSLQALGHKVAPVISSITELTFKVVSTIFFVPLVGYIGVCITEPTIWLVCAIYVISVYLIHKKRGTLFKQEIE